MRRLVLALFALWGLEPGCVQKDTPASTLPLIVGAPPSLREPFEAIAAAYRARHPGQSCTVMFGEPSQLFATGLPLDVIAADDAERLQPLAARLSSSDRRDYAANPLVLVSKVGAPPVRIAQLPVTAWAEKIALADGRGDPSGAAAERLLGRAGSRRALDARLRYVSSAAKVIADVRGGQAQVGFAFATDLAGSDGVQVADRATDAAQARFPIAVVSGTPRLAAARDFVEEVVHGEGPKRFAARGLLAP